MSAVHFSGTFAKDERPLNGFEPYAAEIVREIEDDDGSDWLAVSVMVPHAMSKKPGEASVPTMRHLEIEVMRGEDEDIVRGLIRKYRKARGGEQPDLLDELANGDSGKAFDADGWAKDGDKG